MCNVISEKMFSFLTLYNNLVDVKCVTVATIYVSLCHNPVDAPALFLFLFSSKKKIKLEWITTACPP